MAVCALRAEQRVPTRRIRLARMLVRVARRWVGPAAAALLLFELTVRMFIFSPRPQVFDPALGPMPAPGSTWVNGREGYCRIHWSRQEIRGHDLPAAGTPDVHRIVVMGDSFCVAEGVSDDQTYCARLEDDLSRRLRQRVWVGNCGRPGLDGSDILYLLPMFQRKFHPELTVLTFNLSDFRMSAGKISGGLAHFDPAAAPGEGLTLTPLRKPREDWLMDPILPGRLQPAAHWLIDHCALAHYGAARLYAIRWRMLPEDHFITRKEQIATTDQMVRYFAAMVSQTKTPLACAYIAPWSSLRGQNNQWDEITEQHLREATRRLNIPFVDTGSLFRHRFEQTGQPANGFANTDVGPGYGHLNPEGHRIVAAALTPMVARLIAHNSGPRLLQAARQRVRAAGLAEDGVFRS